MLQDVGVPLIGVGKGGEGDEKRILLRCGNQVDMPSAGRLMFEFLKDKVACWNGKLAQESKSHGCLLYGAAGGRINAF